jgi:hypothetical protein
MGTVATGGAASLMAQLVVIFPLKPNARGRARALLDEATRFDRHGVFLTDREVVFVFEAPGETETLDLPGDDPAVWAAASAWRECLDGRPRIARPAFSWSRTVEDDDLSFAPTPGPGDSEGGDLFAADEATE